MVNQYHKEVSYLETKHKIWLATGILVIVITGFFAFFLLNNPQKQQLNQTKVSDEGIRHVAPPINVSKLNEQDLVYYNKYYVDPTPNSVCGRLNLSTGKMNDEYGNPVDLCIFSDNSTCNAYYVFAKNTTLCPQLASIIRLNTTQ